ncbi:site-specific integrase [Alkalihalobacillus sp. BA299]|uniref:site-specific integrase n=1 Tax=Alkalihalobacillus sp. BA299 TaxID=2815938 RepID=UPI001ADBCB82|nr:site-specific integrase [Alkalihalobacillus sp. BA299]
MENSLAEKTKKVYTQVWRDFEEWCQEHQFSTLPALPETIVRYITVLSENNKPATIKKKMAAISQAHKTVGLASPIENEFVRKTFRGIQKEKGTKQTRKNPLLLEDLQKILEVVPNTKVGLRDRTIIIISFVGALRRSELTTVRVEDLERTREGIIVHINRSKTDTLAEGQEVSLPYGSNPKTCPIRTLERWLEVADITEGYLFPSFDPRSKSGHINDKTVASIVKKYCKKIGLDPDLYSGHSARAGFVTTSALKGIPERQIQRQTRHKNVATLQKYVRPTKQFSDNAVVKIGL